MLGEWLNSRDWKWKASFAATLALPWALLLYRLSADIGASVIIVFLLWDSFEKKQWAWVKDPVVVLGFAVWLWMMVIVTISAEEPIRSLTVSLPWFRFIL